MVIVHHHNKHHPCTSRLLICWSKTQPKKSQKASAILIAMVFSLFAAVFLAASSAMLSSAARNEVAAKLEHRSKYAYATLLCNPAEADQDDYIRMLLVLKENIREFDTDNEIVTMVYGSITMEHRALLTREGIKLINVGDVGMEAANREPIRVPDDVSACYRAKLNAIGRLTLYDRVIFLDCDMLIKKDIRFMFEQNGFVGYEGFEAPLNTGLFAFTPSKDDFAMIEGIMLSNSFSPENGWFGYGKFPHWRLDGQMSDWSFWCAHTDQGILYYYYDKVQQDATIGSFDEGNEVFFHFTGWSKPILHQKDMNSTSTDPVIIAAHAGKEEIFAEWYSRWGRVVNRLNARM